MRFKLISLKFEAVICSIFLLLVTACSSETKKSIQFLEGKSTIELESPEDQMTTMCKISLRGKSECDLILIMPGVNSICIPKGRVDFWRNYEWYDGGKSIIVKNEDECVGNAELVFGYKFSMQYFGRGVGEGFLKCDN